MARHKAHRHSPSEEETATAHLTLLPLMCRNGSLCAAVSAIILRLYMPGLTVDMGHNSLVWLLCAVAFMFMVVDASLHSTWQLRSPHLTAASLACIAFTFASAGWASYAVPAYYQGAIWLSDLLLFAVVLYWSQRHDVAPLFLAVVFASFCLELVYVAYQYFFGLPATRAYVAQHSALLYQVDIGAGNTSLLLEKLSLQQAFGHFTLANSLGGYLIMFLPLLLALICRDWRRRMRWVWLVLLTLAAWALAASKSRGSILALCILALLWLLIYCYRRSDRHWLIACTSMLAGALALVAILAFTDWLDPVGQAAGSFVMRIGYWLSSLQIWQEAPWFGVGVGNFADHYYTYKRLWGEEVNKAHNFYLQWLAETGLVGLALMVFWAWTACRCKQRADRTAAGENKTTADNRPHGVFTWIFLFAALLAFFLLAASGHFVEIEPLLSFLGARLGVAQSTWQPAVPLLYQLAIVLLALFWFITFLVWRHWRLDTTTRRGLMFGVMAFLLHNGLDIDSYDPALSQTAWLFVAFLLVPAPATASYRPTLVAKACCLVATVVGLLWLSLTLVPNLLALAQVKTALPDLRHQIQVAENGERRRELSEIYEKYLALGCRLAPWNHEMNEAQAVLALETARQMAKKRNSRPADIDAVLAYGEACYARTLARRTHFAPAYYGRAQLAWEAARLWRAMGDTARSEQALHKATADIATALSLYPSKGVVCATAGELAEMQGKFDEARRWYQQALYVNDIGIYMWVNLPDEIESVVRRKLTAYLDKH